MNQKDNFPHGFPAKTTVNPFKMFWSKWCFITLTTSVPEYVHISKFPKIRHPKKTQNIFSIVCKSLEVFQFSTNWEKKCFILENITVRWKTSFKLSKLGEFLFLKKVLYSLPHLSWIKTLEIYMGLARWLRW